MMYIYTQKELFGRTADSAPLGLRPSSGLWPAGCEWLVKTVVGQSRHMPNHNQRSFNCGYAVIFNQSDQYNLKAGFPWLLCVIKFWQDSQTKHNCNMFTSCSESSHDKQEL